MLINGITQNDPLLPVKFQTGIHLHRLVGCLYEFLQLQFVSVLKALNSLSNNGMAKYRAPRANHKVKKKERTTDVILSFKN